MAVLVTGGMGFVGSHVVLGLVDAGETVVILDNLSTGFHWNVSDNVELVVGDVGDRELLDRLFCRGNIDGVIHLAGSTNVVDSLSQPFEYYTNNYCSTKTLVDAASAAGVRRLIFTSSAAVYGAPGAKVVSEFALAAPETPYGRSKLQAEWLLEDYGRAEMLSYVVLRCFNIAGGDPQGRSGQSTKGSGHLIKATAEVAVGERPFLEIYGRSHDTEDGTCVRDYVHVTDVADAHIKALYYLRTGGASVTLNCGSGRGYSVLDTLAAFASATGNPIAVREAQPRQGDVAAIVSNSALARRVLNWCPVNSQIDVIVRHSLGWQCRLSNLDDGRGPTASLPALPERLRQTTGGRCWSKQDRQTQVQF